MKKILKFILLVSMCISLFGCSYVKNVIDDDSKLRIIASDVYRDLSLENEVSNVTIDYMSDIDIVSKLNQSSGEYDAILISNSMWTYMLDNVYLTESKSLAISPVVFAVKKDKAQELGLVDTEITNEDILNLIKNKQISYVMPSAVRTNAGATSYLGFINSLSGNPEVLTTEHLENQYLKDNLKTLFNNVERNAGSESYTFDIFESSGCDALVATEASIIKYNKEHTNNPLYMLYPVDGVAVTDSMFTFIGKAEKKDAFIRVRDYLLSNEGQKLFKEHNYRTWYGGSTEIVDPGFNKNWGVDTTKILKVTSFPSKTVMTKAFGLYANLYRKPSVVTFVLDYSGSMIGSGYENLQDAISYVLDTNKSSTEFIQFSKDDRISVIYFSDNTTYYTEFFNGDEAYKIYSNALANVQATGGTPLYEATATALEHVTTEMGSLANIGDYSPSIILMTDGQPTGVSFKRFQNYYETEGYNIPIYAIAFGDADLKELTKVAEMSNGKSFDGRKDLLQAFREIRGYN